MGYDLPPPPRWTRRDVRRLAETLGIVLAPWLAVGALVVAVLFAVRVLP
jgi:hypothetical protein